MSLSKIDFSSEFILCIFLILSLDRPVKSQTDLKLGLFNSLELVSPNK